tara:strand:- start:2252 stop:2458 length:207 start_codon:yes stop_codon:yes gene_type:complete
MLHRTYINYLEILKFCNSENLIIITIYTCVNSLDILKFITICTYVNYERAGGDRECAFAKMEKQKPKD